ncbi:Ger(x)C family spore germination protein [Paenibacillus radicis (ex Xue et al. 2023)]|uniref:Ger(X)C family spore germination protein n=1 Tax=Paenibacillus radicis (ex Xue et al. 2023) TaxID=2972489 RepID=A0ABT1Y8W6_9BACL|nr:Ger(x)C family spore germination protein [Paenibacillus radicis (ex Xue et al. 2023)]MCR8629633.1 Ger(x)C family spore germination protein [Paenibacillus radicis (ex Xue et al. 2023)]
MRRGLLLATMLLVNAVLLSGCWNASDIDNLDYVNAIGIDYSKEEKQFTVYLQLLSFEKVAKTDTGNKSTSTPAWIGIGKGKTYVDAVGNISLEAEKRLYWGHVTALVMGEGLLAKGDITDVLQTFFRFYELRYTMWVYGTRSKLNELFIATPNFEQSRLNMLIHKPIDNFKQRSYITPMRLNDFIATYYEPVQTLLLPAVSVSKEVWHRNDEPLGSMRFEGIFPFRQNKSEGFMPLEQVKGLRWVEKNTNRAPVSVTEKGKELANLRMRRPHYSVKIREENSKPVFDLHVKVDGAITDLNEQVSEQTLCRQAEKIIEKEIRETYENGLKLKVDLLELQKHLYVRGAKRFREYDKDKDQFVLESNSLGNVKVQVEITTAGKYTYRMYKD